MKLTPRDVRVGFFVTGDPGDCLHPISVDLLVDEDLVELELGAVREAWTTWRECALCGLGYNRGLILENLAVRCLEVWAIDLGAIGRALSSSDAEELLG